MQTVVLSDNTFQFPPQIEETGGNRAEKIERFFKMMDANSDGKVTLEEMQECAGRMIDELITMMNEMAANMGQQ